MCFVERNSNDEIISLYAMRQPGFAEEEVADDDPKVVAFRNPVQPSSVVVLYPVDLWSRLTNSEAEQVEAAMATQPIRIQNIFKAASSYRSDHELWTLLQSVAVGLFGEARAASILASSDPALS